MKREYWVLIGLLAVGLWVRVWKLDLLPAGLQNDEASFFYNAKLLRSTGRDEDGRMWPIFLNSFIDPKPALYSYMEMILMPVVGETKWAARLPAALMGGVSLWLVWVWFSDWTSSKREKWIAVGLLAVSPWHVLVSRSTQEVMLSFLFGMGALVCLNKLVVVVESRHASLWFWGGWFCAFMMLSMYGYHSFKLVGPLLVGLILFFRGWWDHKRKDFLILMSLVIILAVGLAVISEGSLRRFEAVNIFSQGGWRAVLSEEIALSTGKSSPFVIRAFHNKVVNIGWEFAKNYFSHFSALFLVFDGAQPERYVIPFMGLIYPLEIVWLLLGIWAVARAKEKHDLGRLFVGWLMIAPLPAAVTTQEVPSLTRAFWMCVPVTFLIMKGIFFGYDRWWSISKKTLMGWIWGALLVGGYVWGMLYAIHQWQVFGPYYHPWHRNVADQKLVLVLKSMESEYERVVISRWSGQPYIYLALEGLIRPEELQRSYPLRLRDDFVIGKYDFRTGICPLAEEKAVLFVVRGNCPLPSGYTLLEKALYDDENDGYSLVIWSGL